MDNQTSKKISATWALAGAGWFLSIGLLVLGWMYLEKRFPEQAAVAIAPENAGGHVPDEALPANAVCPVTGKILVVTSATPRARYSGKLYFFDTAADNEGRDAKYFFLMNPDQYLDK